MQDKAKKYIGESKPYLIWTVFAVVAIIAMAYYIGGFANKKTDSKVTEATPTISANINENMQKAQDVSELKIEDLKVGTGTEAVAGKKVTVNYKGTLLDGTKFDSSYDRGIPFSFNLGAGEVIKGWDQGVVGMKIGGKRKLTIPSSLGYGSRGAGGVIPPNAALVFEVELLEVE